MSKCITKRHKQVETRPMLRSKRPVPSPWPSLSVGNQFMRRQTKTKLDYHWPPINSIVFYIQLSPIVYRYRAPLPFRATGRPSRVVSYLLAKSYCLWAIRSDSLIWSENYKVAFLIINLFYQKFLRYLWIFHYQCRFGGHNRTIHCFRVSNRALLICA